MRSEIFFKSEFFWNVLFYWDMSLHFFENFCEIWDFFESEIFFEIWDFFEVWKKYWTPKKIEISLFLEYPSLVLRASAPLGPAAHSEYLNKRRTLVLFTYFQSQTFAQFLILLLRKKLNRGVALLQNIVNSSLKSIPEECE